MDFGKLIFLAIVFIWIYFFLRVPLVTWRTTQYVKKKYQKQWEEQFQLQIGPSLYGGSTVFQHFSKLKDPKIADYKKQWEKSVKQLFIAILLSLILVLLFIFLQETASLKK